MKSVTTYTRTPAGNAHATAVPGIFENTTKFCFAHLRVAKIVRFTEPGSINGITVSNVTWIPAIASMDDWARQVLAGKKLPSMQHLVDEATSAERNAVVELTNKGWETAQL